RLCRYRLRANWVGPARTTAGACRVASYEGGWAAMNSANSPITTAVPQAASKSARWTSRRSNTMSPPREQAECEGGPHRNREGEPGNQVEGNPKESSHRDRYLKATGTR